MEAIDSKGESQYNPHPRPNIFRFGKILQRLHNYSRLATIQLVVFAAGLSLRRQVVYASIPTVFR